jgi:hypothetical protein
MQHAVTDSPATPVREAPGHTYAEPLAGLRVSWGAILSGTVALLAVALILWALALAVVSLVAHPSGVSMKGSAMALWICGMATTLVGAFVGGFVAGYLPGNARRSIVLAHGFLAWSVALLVSFAFEVYLLRGALAAAANTLADAVAAEAAEAGPMGEPGMRGGPMATPSRGEAIEAGKIALDYMRGAGWSWFGTWFLAGVAALAGAGMAARRLGGPALPRQGRLVPEREPPVGPTTPLTPIETT